MGLILDFAVVALAVAVIGSLALLSWTLAVSAVRAVREGRERVAGARGSIDEAEGRLRTAAARASATLARLGEHTAPPGDRSDQ